MIKLLPYLIPLIFSVLLALGAAFYIWRQGGFEAIVSIIILLAGAQWVFSYIMEIVVQPLNAKVFWNQMQYVGGTILISGLLILALQSIGYDRWVTRRNLLLWNIIPSISLILIFTNSWHGLFWPEHYLIIERDIVWLDHPHGPAYYLYIFYIYLVVVSTIILLLRTILRPRSKYRLQAAMILSGITLPFIFGILPLKFLYPLNLTQMAFTLSVVPLTWGLLRLQVGDVLPVARTAVFDGMADGVIVLDGQQHIIDINSAASQLLERPKKELVGQSIEKVWADGRFLYNIGHPTNRTWLRPAGRLYLPGTPAETRRETVFVRENEKRIYDVRISPLVDWRSYIIGQIIVLRDITERVKAERLVQKAKEDLETEVAERTAALRQANEQLQHELRERRLAEAALLQAHNELEQRVAERTADLAQANTRLTQELTEREHIENQLRTSLQEKEVLLKEIHHRVKNNLQIISSILNLQSGYVDDTAALGIFQDSQNRVRSMALIHEKLYQSANLALVDFGDYIKNLAAYLVRSYSKAGVQLKFEVEPVHLGIDTAVPCGLILNELISNALKHAFPAGQSGHILISLHLESDRQVCLQVADNGVGLPAGLNLLESPSLGLQLVHALVSQIEGEMQINQSGSGLQFNLIFPYKKVTTV